MNVVVASAHRNNGAWVSRYFAQVAALAAAIAPNRLRVIAVEGDSTDDTRDALLHQARVRSLDLELVECRHGGPIFGSTEDPARMAALSKVGNAIFDSVGLKDDVLVYVECDLLWDAADIARLIAAIPQAVGGFDILAPLVMAGEHFYDIWAFRDVDGARFGPFKPYHPSLNGKVMEIGSAGSCLVMHGGVARHVRIRDSNALVGWCAEARRQGYRIAVDPSVEVRHP